MADDGNLGLTRSKRTQNRREGSRKHRRLELLQNLEGQVDPVEEAGNNPGIENQIGVLNEEGGGAGGEQDEGEVPMVSMDIIDDSDSDWEEQAENYDHDNELDDVNVEDPDWEEEHDANNAAVFEDEGSDEDNEEVFNLEAASLDRNIGLAEPRSVRDALLLQLCLAMRHHWTYECLIQSFQTQNMLMGRRFLPMSKSELWKVICRPNPGTLVHVYCDCWYYLGRKKVIEENKQCPSCQKLVDLKKAKHFFVLSIRKQLETFLNTPGVAEALKYRETRTKVQENAVEDIFDSDQYRLLQAKMGAHDLTYSVNVDGCRATKGARTSLYVFYMRIHELPPNLRQKHMILIGVWVGKGDPEMSTLLLPIVNQLNKLNTEGIDWNPPNEERRVTHIFPTTVDVDGKARYQVFNMSPHNCEYGCTMCLIKGTRIDNVMRYPYNPHDNIPAYEDRTHQRMKADMLEAHRQKKSVYGHKGLTPLMGLRHFDMAHGQGYDDLHNFYECVAAVLLDLLIKNVPKVNDLGMELFMQVVDSRMLLIKTPSKIARKPGTCKLKNRSQLHGTELRNWTLYYSVPCLQGLIAPRIMRLFELFSNSAFLLSQDSILEDHILRAERNICHFLTLFEEIFGVERTRLNIHNAQHAVKCVRNWSALWNQSTFGYESWNKKIIDSITSPKGAAHQVITRHLLLKQLETTLLDENVSADVRDQMAKILGRKRYARFQYLLDGVYALPANERAPSEDEMAILVLEGFQTDALTTYKKLLVKSVAYCPTNNVKANSKSDNSIIYTWQDTFCTINEIVSFRQEGVLVCGCFVMEHTIRPRRFEVATHISVLDVTAQGIPHFITVGSLRSPVVSIKVLEETYVVPMPNTFEID